MNKMNLFFLSAAIVMPGPLMLWRYCFYCCYCWLWWWCRTHNFSSHIVNELNKNCFSPFFPAPSPPRNVRLLAVTANSIQVSWWEPARANGVLQVGKYTTATLTEKHNEKHYLFVFQGYRVYFLHDNFTSVQTVRGNKSAMIKTITRLGE